jgi:hypothetical protein
MTPLTKEQREKIENLYPGAKEDLDECEKLTIKRFTTGISEAEEKRLDSLVDKLFPQHKPAQPYLVCEFTGPYFVVITSPDEKDKAYPQVIGPYNSTYEADRYIQKFKDRKDPYLGLKFAIGVQRSESAFGAFCSWED